MKEKDLSFQKYLEFLNKKEEKKIENKRPEKKKEKKKKTSLKKEKKVKEKSKIEKKEIKTPSEPKEPELFIPEIELEEEREKEYVIFKIGKEYYAVQTSQTQEIVSNLEITVTPDLPPYSIGITNFRESIIPVVSLGKMLHIEEEKPPFSYILIEKEEKALFFRIESVEGIKRDKELKALIPPYDLDKDIFKEIYMDDRGNLITVIDIIKLAEKKG